MNRIAGDIRNFPRKDALEEDIAHTVKDVFDMPVTVERVIIFGSWGNGTAKPFRSDLDVNVVINNPDGDVLSRDFQSQIEFKQQELLANTLLTRSYVLFDGADILIHGTNTSMEGLMKASLTDGNKKAYDLTNRVDIHLDSDSAIVGL